MSELNGAPHLLGVKPRIGTNFTALVRHLDADGTMQADGVRVLPDGNAAPVVSRECYLDGDELLAAIRQVVRDELTALFAEHANCAPFQRDA